MKQPQKFTTSKSRMLSCTHLANAFWKMKRSHGAAENWRCLNVDGSVDKDLRGWLTVNSLGDTLRKIDLHPKLQSEYN